MARLDRLHIRILSFRWNPAMILQWFNSSEATKIAIELADQFAPHQATPAAKNTGNELAGILERADQEVRALRLTFYKKAKFANSFKWRLLENGVEKSLADEVTQRLVLHLSSDRAASSDVTNEVIVAPPHSNSPKYLLEQGNRCIAQEDYSEAVVFYQHLLTVDPRHVVAINNLAAALAKLGRHKEAESLFFRAIKIKPDFPDAHSNLGNSFLLKGQYAAAEPFLRRSLKLNPRLVEARVNLGLALSFLSRLGEARSHFEKALKHEPRNGDALSGLAFIAMTEGNFGGAGAMLSRALQVNPRMPRALALQTGLRKMTPSDSEWLKSAEEVAAGTITSLDESELRFSIGKYYDDVENYKLAFENYKKANDLLKPIAQPYDREAYKRFVDIMIRVYTPEAVAGSARGMSTSMKPVLVVGMPRSGTSLTEQIIASHPLARGAGELDFWSNTVHEHEATIKETVLDEAVRTKLADEYLRVLATKSENASRVVDKAVVNTDYLGIIHSVFPNARIIYMRRDPIDACLSCYFQKFVLSLNFTLDLADLADYYGQHRRLMAHWRAVLPKGVILDVPYEEMVADQSGWSRKILDFLGLEWDERVLEFHTTERPVVTAAFWQVRQRMYTNSVRRWRNYQKFIGPLRDLGN
jgi:Flp pilus assembly protein TadD